uniref:Uncharacterized protein n=1 Tax=Siphoviridae sp. ctFIm6 TaxID=2827818 RepID=A0A8S5SK54_9CAUD|nr:MAG TPA: hypothetical protein [Siphoviridae sp. ctFIm6]
MTVLYLSNGVAQLILPQEQSSVCKKRIRKD